MERAFSCHEGALAAPSRCLCELASCPRTLKKRRSCCLPRWERILAREGLQGFRDADVLRIAALIEIDLFALDRLELSARGRGSAGGGQFFRGGDGLQLVVRVVRPLPGKPVSGQLCVRRLELRCREGKGAA